MSTLSAGSSFIIVMVPIDSAGGAGAVLHISHKQGMRPKKERDVRSYNIAQELLCAPQYYNLIPESASWSVGRRGL